MVTIPTESKILLDSLCALLQAPPARIVEDALTSYANALPEKQRVAVKNLVEAAHDAARDRGSDANLIPSYRHSRLCFRRDFIEALGPNDVFRVITPAGTFQMTKAQFYEVFPNVAKSAAYTDSGRYPYPQIPARAERFRV